METPAAVHPLHSVDCCSEEQEVLLFLGGEHLCRGRSLLTGFDHRWRWLAIEIVRVVEVAHPHAVHEILGLWVREVVVLLDLPRVTFAS